MFRQTTNDKQTLKTQARKSSKRLIKSAGRCSLPNFKKQFKQQRQQRRLKDDLIFNLRNSREFRFIQFVYTVRHVPNKIYESVRFRKINFKNCPRTVHVLSNMKNVAFSCCCFVTFCKQRQRNEQRIITHAYTAIREFTKPRRRRRGQRRVKTEFIFYLRISRYSEVIYFVYPFQNYLKTQYETQR